MSKEAGKLVLRTSSASPSSVNNGQSLSSRRSRLGNRPLLSARQHRLTSVSSVLRTSIRRRLKGVLASLTL